MIPRHPFLGCHARMGLKGSEKRGFGGKSRLQIQDGDFHVGLFAQQLLCVGDAMAIDEVGEGAAFLRVDAVGNVVAVEAELVGDIFFLQFAV